MSSSESLGDVDFNESKQIAIEIKSLLTLSPEKLALTTVVEMKNEKISSLKTILSKFDWLNTDDMLEGKNLVETNQLKSIFLTTYQLLTELDHVDKDTRTIKIDESKAEGKMNPCE